MADKQQTDPLAKAKDTLEGKTAVASVALGIAAFLAGVVAFASTWKAGDGESAWPAIVLAIVGPIASAVSAYALNRGRSTVKSAIMQAAPEVIELLAKQAKTSLLTKPATPVETTTPRP